MKEGGLPAKKIKTVNFFPKLTGQPGNMSYIVLTQPTTAPFGVNNTQVSNPRDKPAPSTSTKAAAAATLLPRPLIEAEPHQTADKETTIGTHCLLCDKNMRHYSEKRFTNIYRSTEKSEILRKKLQEALKRKLPPYGNLSSDKICQSCVHRLDKVVEGQQEARSISAACKAKTIQKSLSVIPQISNPVDKNLLEDIRLQMAFIANILRRETFTEKITGVVLLQLTKLVELFISTFFRRSSLGDIMLQSESDTTEMSLGFVLEALKGEQSQPTNIPDQAGPQSRVSTDPKPQPRVSTDPKPQPRISTGTKTTPRKSTETNTQRAEDTFIPIQIKPEPESWDVRGQVADNQNIQSDDFIENVALVRLMAEEVNPEVERLDCEPSTTSNMDCEPSATSNTNCEPSTSLKIDCEPNTTFNMDCEPSTTSNTNCEPSTSLKIDCEPNTTFNMNCEPSTTSNTTRFMEYYRDVVNTDEAPEPVLQIPKVESLSDSVLPDTKSQLILYRPPVSHQVKVYSQLPTSKRLKHKEYRCFICEYSTETPLLYFEEHLLYSHVWEKHLIQSEGAQHIKCPDCNADVTFKKVFDNPMVAGEYLFRMVMRHLVCKHGYGVPDYVVSEGCRQQDCCFLALTQPDMTAHELLHRKGAYFCAICGQGFVKEVTCCQHLVHQHDTYPPSHRVYTCNLCEFGCVSQVILREHTKKKHPEVKKQKIKKSKETQPVKKQKSKKNKEIQPPPTKTAKQKDKSRKVLRKHKKSKKGRYLISYKEHVCFICEITNQDLVKYLSEEDLYNHIAEEHVSGGEESADIQCPKCDLTKTHKASSSNSVMMRRGLAYHHIFVHLNTEHQLPVPEYVNAVNCDFAGCSFSAVSKPHLGIHKNRLHKEKALCKHCGKTTRDSSLKRHEICCQANPDRKELTRKTHCPICGIRPFQLQTHMKLHDKSKTVCEVCSKPFPKHAVKVHMFLVHGLNPDNKETVKCPDCDYVTLMPPCNLRYHRKQKHEPIRRRKCPLCQVNIIQGHYHAHLRSVHGPPSFVCSQCPFKASTGKGLSLHMAAQHLGVRFQCDWCPYTSGYHSNVIKHHHTCRKNPANRPRKQGSDKPNP